MITTAPAPFCLSASEVCTARETLCATPALSDVAAILQAGLAKPQRRSRPIEAAWNKHLRAAVAARGIAPAQMDGMTEGEAYALVLSPTVTESTEPAEFVGLPRLSAARLDESMTLVEKDRLALLAAAGGAYAASLDSRIVDLIRGFGGDAWPTSLSQELAQALATHAGVPLSAARQTLPRNVLQILRCEELRFGGTLAPCLRYCEDLAQFSAESDPSLVGLTPAEFLSAAANAVLFSDLAQTLIARLPTLAEWVAQLVKAGIIHADAAVIDETWGGTGLLRQAVLQRLEKIHANVVTKSELPEAQDPRVALRQLIDLQAAIPGSRASWPRDEVLFDFPAEVTDGNGQMVGHESITDLTLADFCKGFLILGQTGCGKTSAVGRSLAMKMLRADFGFLVLCKKSDERPMWEAMAKACGREKDLLPISWKNPAERRGFNFLEYLRQRFKDDNADPQIIRDTLMTICEVMRGGNSQKGGSNPYFFNAMTVWLTYALTLSLLADEPLRIASLIRLSGAHPDTIKEGSTPKWREESYCAYLLQRARRRIEAIGDDILQTTLLSRLADTERYFLDELAGQANVTRSGVLGEFSAAFSDLATSPMLRTLFSNDSDYTPADAFDGKIIIMDVPQAEYNETGLAAAATISAMFQRIVMAREDRGDFTRPVSLWIDEAHTFVAAKRTSAFISGCRSLRCSVVLMTQGLSSFHEAFDGKEESVDGLIQNLATQIICRITDKKSFAHFRDIAGDQVELMHSTNNGTSRGAMDPFGNTSAGTGSSEIYRPQLPANVLAGLATVKIPSRPYVDALVFPPGDTLGNRVWFKARFPFVPL